MGPAESFGPTGCSGSVVVRRCTRPPGGWLACRRRVLGVPGLSVGRVVAGERGVGPDASEAAVVEDRDAVRGGDRVDHRGLLGGFQSSLRLR